MGPVDGLRHELENEFSFHELFRMAERRGLKRVFKSKEEISFWLVENGLTWREYDLKYSPYISLKFRICKFFGIRKKWRVMDIGCGSGGASVSAACLVGNNGYVLAVDPWEEYLNRCKRYVKKLGFQDTVETKLGNVLELEFDLDNFDMIIMLYSPQFLGYMNDLKQILTKIKGWTNRIGIADHIAAPSTLQEGVYLLYNWLSNDVNRKSDISSI